MVLAAKVVAEKKTTTFEGKTLRLELKSPLMSSGTQQPLVQSETTKSDDPELDLEVTGLPDKTSRDYLENFFSHQRIKGGDIKDLKFDPETGTAMVTYVSKQGSSLPFNMLFMVNIFQVQLLIIFQWRGKCLNIIKTTD